MTLIHPAVLPASLVRRRRTPQTGAATRFVFAGAIAVVVFAMAASSHRLPPPAETALVAPVVAAPAARAPVMPPSRAEQLASVVARRYKVAEDAASAVVRAAIREGQQHNLDPVLILAVIAVESRFNPFAASEQGALGLMQIVPRFHMDKIAAIGVPGMLLPDANIAIGTLILKDSIRRGGSDAAGLQLYNGAFEDETRAYANRVLAERRRLEEALPRARNKA